MSSQMIWFIFTCVYLERTLGNVRITEFVMGLILVYLIFTDLVKEKRLSRMSVGKAIMVAF